MEVYNYLNVQIIDEVALKTSLEEEVQHYHLASDGRILSARVKCVTIFMKTESLSAKNKLVNCVI